jgi:transcriptional regulator with XRE-family HTH domain
MKDSKNNLAAKLNRLFEEKRKPDGTQYTQTEVVESSKGVLTRVYLWKLRKGRARNPGFKVIQVLAQCFDVDPSYFFESDETKGEPSKQERDVLVDKIALRSSKLDENGKQAVLYMIESIAKSKGKKRK